MRYVSLTLWVDAKGCTHAVLVTDPYVKFVDPPLDEKEIATARAWAAQNNVPVFYEKET